MLFSKSGESSGDEQKDCGGECNSSLKLWIARLDFNDWIETDKEKHTNIVFHDDVK